MPHWDLGLGSGTPKVRKAKGGAIYSDETLHRLECKACPLNGQAGLRHPNMAATGSNKPLVYCLGEGPGETEDINGAQFIGKSGQMIRSRIPDRYEDKIRWNNVVRTRPPGNRTPTRTEIECCRPSIVRDIEQTKPRAIFGFGGVPLTWATGLDSIYQWRGRHMPVQIGSHAAWFFPMLHPAGLLRGASQGAEEVFDRDLRDAFRKLKELGDPAFEIDIPKQENGKYADVNYVLGQPGDLARVEKWFNYFRKASHFTIDLETTTKERMQDRQVRPYAEGAKILTVALAAKDKSFGFPLHHSGAKWSPGELIKLEKMFSEFLYGADGVKIAHNLSFELEWLAYFYGKELVYAGQWHDTMAQAYVLDERRRALGLDDLTVLHFGFSLKSLFQLNKGNMDSEPLARVLPYNCLDSLYDLKLYNKQRVLLKEKGLRKVSDAHVPPVQTAVLTQHFGNELNYDLLRDLGKKYDREIEETTNKILGLDSIKKFEKWRGKKYNPGSSSENIVLFRDFLEQKEGYTDERSRKYSVDDDVLKKMDTPLAKLIQKYRAVVGAKGKYIDPLKPEAKECVFPDNRIHPNIHIFFTKTGRTSSSFPNQQFFPKRSEEYRELRAAFDAESEDCYVVPIDQGQIEARVIQMAAKDPRYGQYLWDRRDVHMDWTQRLAHAYPKRIGGKKFLKDKDVLKAFRYDVKNQWTFPLFFGANEYSVSKYLSIPIHVVDPLIVQFWDEFSGVKEWQEELEAFYHRKGYVECLTGRRRHAPITYNELINSPVQGTASDITVSAWCRLSRAAAKLGLWQFQARLEVHDELVFYIPKKTFDRDIEFIAEHMLETEHYPFINVPLCIEISRGPDWHNQEPVATLYSDDFGLIDRKKHGY
jgi:uracil-DNA glycosylase family 4